MTCILNCTKTSIFDQQTILLPYFHDYKARHEAFETNFNSCRYVIYPVDGALVSVCEKIETFQASINVFIFIGAPYSEENVHQRLKF